MNQEKLLTCPYNLAHQIIPHKMQTHLEKCRKNYPHEPNKQCPFDATHIVKEVELDYHISKCDKRETFDRSMYNVDSGKDYRPSIAQPTPVPQCEENWDDDNYKSYNPKTLGSDPNVILRPRGQQPAERRQFRLKQRQEFGSNSKNKESGSSSNNQESGSSSKNGESGSSSKNGESGSSSNNQEN